MAIRLKDATVNVQSLATSTVHDTDVTDNNGALNIIGVPAGANMYRIAVTKQGYSSDRTYPVGGSGNPSPNNADATVINQQVTNTSFSIDKLSSLNFTSVSPTCVPVGGIGFSMVGSKLIGTGVTKYPTTNLSTNSGGILNLNNMEWDTYNITPTATTYDIGGINPFSPLTLHPNNAQNVQFVVVPKSGNGNGLMVSVTDKTTNLSLSGATVELTGQNHDQTMITGQGYIYQTSWLGGDGQDIVGDPTRYSKGTEVDTSSATSSGSILLFNSGFNPPFNTNATSTLESSTFDTGTTSNFYALSWSPINQPLPAGLVSVKLQFATAPSTTPPNSTWNFIGPDGTSYSYYTIPGKQISFPVGGNEFARYKIFMNTQTATVTPSVTNVSFSYTSGCIPPGQVLFQGFNVNPNPNYTLTVLKQYYQTQTVPIILNSGWQQIPVLLTPIPQ